MFGSDERPHVPEEPRRISEMDVHAVRDLTEMFSNYDYRYGGGQPRLQIATALQTQVLPHLSLVSGESALGRSYFAEVAGMVRLAGWTAYDTGHHARAQWYMLQAFRLAREARDKAMCARILSGLSHQANFLGYHEKAVHLARAALHGAQGYTTPTSLSLASAMAARGLAMQGNEPETTAALLDAEKWLDQRVLEDDPVWLRYFDHAELYAEFAHCYRELNKPELASYYASESARMSENLYVRSLSFVRTVLATAHLQANELEEAIAVADGVADTAEGLRSKRVLAYLVDFGKQLEPHQAHPLAVDFRNKVRRLVSKDTPAARSAAVA